MRLQYLETLVAFIFDVCAKETAEALETLKIVVEKNLKSVKNEE